MKKSTLFLALFPAFCLAFGLAACSSGNKPENTYRSQNEDRPLVDDKYTLQADRKAFDEIRAQVPADKKRENDELALILGMMSEVKKPPTDIRNQFDSLLRKKRQQFDKDITKEREIFTKEERKKREAFLKSQQEDRAAFNREKTDRETKNKFYKELDEKRSEFTSVERDKRADFESDVRERRKNFEDYIREKQNEFNQELRAYSKKYEELKKSSSNNQSQQYQQTFQSSEISDLERDLQEAKRRTGTPLEAGE